MILRDCQTLNDIIRTSERFDLLYQRTTDFPRNMPPYLSAMDVDSVITQADSKEDDPPFELVAVVQEAKDAMNGPADESNKTVGQSKDLSPQLLLGKNWMNPGRCPNRWSGPPTLTFPSQPVRERIAWRRSSLRLRFTLWAFVDPSSVFD
jgi:hypothetical protein